MATFDSPAPRDSTSTLAPPNPSFKGATRHQSQQGEKGGECIDERGRRVFRTTSAPPVEPRWSRFIPGGYNAKWQVPLKGKAMTRATTGLAGLAILAFGYDQGVMSGVNNIGEYKRLMGVDSDSQRDSAALGGIVAIYYLGTLIGGFFGGWAGDLIGRVKVIEIACVLAAIGAALQAGSQDIVMMMFGRVICGLGTGVLNAIIPVLSSELSSHDGRGAVLGFEFMLNITGLATAYWLEFGLKWASNRSDAFVWRFPLAFQIVFFIIILFSISMFPESPRWLAKMGRVAEARHVLAVCRTPDGDEDDERVSAELYDIMETAEFERQQMHLNSYRAMLFGSDSYHLKRRTWLVIWLQTMQELIGCGVVSVYAPEAFKSAGYSSYKSDLLSGCNDISYIASVLVAVFTLDRVGRRVTLYWGAIAMGVSLLIAGAAAIEVPKASGDKQAALGAVVATGVFTYTASFGSTWLYPTEIFPTFIRAKGGAMSVAGWSVGNGIVTEMTPFLFNAIGGWTLVLFGVLNFCTLPFVYFWYPETAGRTLEEMDILFSSDSMLVHKQEKDLAAMEAADPELVHAMKIGDRKSVARKQSYRPQGAEQETRFKEHADQV